MMTRRFPSWIVLLVFAGICTGFVHASEPLVVSGLPDQPIPKGWKTYNITVREPIVTAEIRVSVRISHEQINNLEFLLQPPQGFQIPLAFAKPLPSRAEYTLTFHSQDSLNSSMELLSGIQARGIWSLRVFDRSLTSVGVLRSWSIEIHPVDLGRLSASNGEERFTLDVDGYGSFGDQGYRSDTFLGGQYPTGDTRNSTVFHSALFLHNSRRYLTSLDMFPGPRLPSVSVQQTDEQTVKSRFRVEGLDMDLTQRLLVESDGSFVLSQAYIVSSTNPVPLIVTRYINPVFHDELGYQNYAAVKNRGGFMESLFAFDEIPSATTDVSRYVAIEFESSTARYLDFLLTYFAGVNGRMFAQEIWERNLLFYQKDFGSGSFNDFNTDGVTDPKRGLDISMALEAELTADASQRFSYTAITRWGISSPSTMLQAPPLNPFTPTPTPEPTSPPTVTPTPEWTSTPSFSPQPTSTPALLFLRAPLPDIRLQIGQKAEAVLDLRDYLSIPNASPSLWRCTVLRDAGLPIRIDGNHILSFDEVGTPGDYGDVLLEFSDGQSSLSLSFRVKVSSFRTNSFYPVPPIVLAPGENRYTSPYRLNDFLPSPRPDDSSLWRWSAPPTLPPGVTRIEIRPDSSFLLETDDRLPSHLVSVPFLVQRVPATSTPVPTPSPTPFSTPTPVFSPTLSPTPRSPRTFTPTPTATKTCEQRLVFLPRDSYPTGAGPVDWLPMPYSNEFGRQWLVANYDDGTVTFHQGSPTGSSEVQSFPVGYGVSETALGDLNGDGRADFVALNPLEEELYLFLGASPSGFQQGLRFDMASERFYSYASSQSAYKYKSLVVGQILPEGPDELALRTQDGLILLSWTGNRWNELQRILVSGSSRFLEGVDLENDGDVDLLLGLRTPESREQLRVLQNDSGRMEAKQTLPIDLAFPGNYARQVVATDWSRDGFADLLVLDFSGAIQVFLGTVENGFLREAEWNLFPPGSVETIGMGDLDGDSVAELVVLHQSQAGQVLYAVCGQSLFSHSAMVHWPVSEESQTGNRRSILRLVDWDGDQDADIFLSRSDNDDLLRFENLSSQQP